MVCLRSPRGAAGVGLEARDSEGLEQSLPSWFPGEKPGLESLLPGVRVVSVPPAPWALRHTCLVTAPSPALPQQMEGVQGFVK